MTWRRWFMLTLTVLVVAFSLVWRNLEGARPEWIAYVIVGLTLLLTFEIFVVLRNKIVARWKGNGDA